MKRERGVKRVSRRKRERGFVTVELAFAALGIGLAVVLCAGLVRVSLAQVRCSDAAAEIARQAARDDLDAVRVIKAGLPEAAAVDMARDGDLVVVTVAMDVAPWGSWLPPIRTHARATVVHEAGG
ncbi:MAG: pilus assembly protein TadE [Propionibacteriaceae bacterium]|jgi:hypothetical protein|nr:pilus assembly protein TadE [Propionibacteriaceae bacterium]